MNVGDVIQHPLPPTPQTNNAVEKKHKVSFKLTLNLG